MGYKQTTVEWLMDNIDFNFNPTTKTFEIDKYHFRVALQMEKEQIKQSFKDCHDLGHIYGLDAEEYYNQTYGE
jgi:hypothetical protein